MIHWKFTTRLFKSELEKWIVIIFILHLSSLNLFQKFRTEETSVLPKQKHGQPEDSGRKLHEKVDGKEMKQPLFVSKPPIIHFKVALGRQSRAWPVYNGIVQRTTLFFLRTLMLGKRIRRKSPWRTAALSVTTASSSGSPPNCKTLSLSSKNLTLAV